MAGSSEKCVVAVVAEDPEKAPLPDRVDGCEFRLIGSAAQLVTDAADADVVLSWQPRLDWLERNWGWSPRLRWINAANAGVDHLMFPGLVRSGVTVTNASGVFNDSIAEYVLGLALAACTDLPATLRLQSRHQWLHRETRRLAGSEVLVLGAGGIGRAVTRLMNAAGTRARCLARTRREDPEFGAIGGIDELPARLPSADFVVLALPFTPETRHILGPAEFGLMRDDGWLVNVGRGALVDEPALVDALERNRIGGAALDVFETEPLPEDSPLWDLQNVIVSPHMSGDARGWERALMDLFLAQLDRYRSGKPLVNVVDKSLGYVPGTRA